MMLTINDLLKQLIDVEPTPQRKNIFCVTFNPETAEIVSVGSLPADQVTHNQIEIDEELGVKFLSAEEDITKWMIDYVDGKFSFKKRPVEKIEAIDRVSLSPIVQLKIHPRIQAMKARDALLERISEAYKLKKIKDEPYFFPKNYWRDVSVVNKNTPSIDVEITLIKKLNKILISYDPSIIHLNEDNLKFFFTREDDITHLKGVLNLNEETLSKIMEQNGLDEWPRSFYITLLGGIDDISIYTLKSQLNVFVSEK